MPLINVYYLISDSNIKYSMFINNYFSNIESCFKNKLLNNTVFLNLNS